MMPHARFSPAITFIFVTAFLDVMAMGIVIPVLPKLIEEFTGSNAAAGVYNGLFVALWAGMQFIFSPIIGSLSDRYGRRPVILISAAGLAADFVLMALAPNLWWLAVGRILGGITSSSFTTAYAYMADVTAPDQRSRAYGLIGAAFSGGFVAGPMLGGLLGEWGPRVPFWAAALLGGIAFLYGLLVLPESLPREKRMAFSWTRANPFGALKLLRSHPELSGLSIVNFLLYFAHHVFSAVFVLYAAFRYGWSSWEIGLSLALWGVLDVGVQAILVGPVVKRLGDRKTMAIGLFFGAAGLALLGLAETGWAFIAGIFISSLWGLAMPTLLSLMTQRVSESEQGQLQGANMSVASVAGILSPLFFGWIYSTLGRRGSPRRGARPRLPHRRLYFVRRRLPWPHRRPPRHLARRGKGAGMSYGGETYHGLGGWRRMSRICLCALALVVAFPAPAAAQDKGWIVTLGPGAAWVPKYPGSDAREVRFWPIIDVRRADQPQRFETPDENFGFGIIEARGFRAGPSINIQDGRDEDEAIPGIGDVGTTVEGGAFAEAYLGNYFRLRGDVRKGFGGHKGLVGDVGGDFILGDPADRLLLSAGPRLRFANARYVRAFFGVNPQQSALTGLPAHDVGGGLHSAGALAFARYRLSDRLGVQAYSRYDRLLGDAADSPLVRSDFGSRDQVEVGIGLTYSFSIG